MAMSESDHPRSALEEDFLLSKSSRTNERTPDPQERLSDERESAQGHSNLFQCSICDQYLKSKIPFEITLIMFIKTRGYFVVTFVISPLRIDKHLIVMQNSFMKMKGLFSATFVLLKLLNPKLILKVTSEMFRKMRDPSIVSFVLKILRPKVVLKDTTKTFKKKKDNSNVSFALKLLRPKYA